jgi:hypothetical protein
MGVASAYLAQDGDKSRLICEHRNETSDSMRENAWLAA